jgi:hypothetical protein
MEFFELKIKKPYSEPNRPARDELWEWGRKRNLREMSVVWKKYPQSVNQRAPFMITPLHEACRVGDRAIVEFLLMKNVEVNVV